MCSRTARALTEIALKLARSAIYCVPQAFPLTLWLKSVAVPKGSYDFLAFVRCFFFLFRFLLSTIVLITTDVPSKRRCCSFSTKSLPSTRYPILSNTNGTLKSILQLPVPSSFRLIAVIHSDSLNFSPSAKLCQSKELNEQPPSGFKSNFSCSTVNE